MFYLSLYRLVAGYHQQIRNIPIRHQTERSQQRGFQYRRYGHARVVVYEVAHAGRILWAQGDGAHC